MFSLVLAAIAVMNLVQNGGTSISTGAFFGICGVAGLIGGFIFLCIWKLGLFALGAILGFVLSAVILSFVSGSISQGAGRVVFIVGMCLGFAVLVFFFEKSLYIVATAIPGAYAVVLGIDGFAKVGFRDATMTFLGKGTFETSPKLFAMIGGFFVAAGVGIGVQTYLFYRRKRRGGYVEAKQDEGKGEMEKVSLLESGDKQYPQKAP
ncbi:hypothetical protein BC829DRAFT_128014 [Chytridium lagenaria]|nr:hypothetical protein BC829DRAFT_128014 [Chytridium lagenaria]